MTRIRTSTLDHLEAVAMFNLERRMRWYDDKSKLAGGDIQELNLIRICDGGRVRNTEEDLIVKLLDRDRSFSMHYMHCLMRRMSSRVFVEIDRGVGRLELPRN